MLALRVATPMDTCQAKNGAFMLSKQALQDFKDIWKKKYGEEISDDFAMEQAISLLTLFDAIYRPVKEDWLKDLEENYAN